MRAFNPNLEGPERPLQAVVSGSFSRHLREIQAAVDTLKARGAVVLSPERPVVVDALSGFVFVESDRHRSVKLVQDRHLAAIADADFLWLVASDGHVGQSAAMELGFAVASRTPVYGTHAPHDPTMRQYITVVPSLNAAIDRAARPRRATGGLSLLVDPVGAAERAGQALERLRGLLTKTRAATDSTHLAEEVEAERRIIARLLLAP